MTHPETIGDSLEKRNINRRSFLKLCGMMASVLALPKSFAGALAQGVMAATRLPVVWLEFQDCTGDSESFLRASPRQDPLQSSLTDPSIIDLLLDLVSLEYHETLMVPSGFAAHASLQAVLDQYNGQYLCVVEGSIPTAANGVYCTIGGRSALSIAQQACSGARANMALGACAYDGGLARAAPNLTGATGLAGAVPNAPDLINLPGCPSNVVNVVASIAYFLGFNSWPAMDSKKRPYFAYGSEIHENCERHIHYEHDRFVLAWGDEGHRQGWCLYRMGCKGPETDSNCPAVRWNQGTSWPIGAGHGCIGCTTDRFWDRLPPVYTPVDD